MIHVTIIGPARNSATIGHISGSTRIDNAVVHA
ncbi:hypothetical protein PMI07_005544 [Rhizobium sp. CF080]|nr:hypothetical protein PMI07_005544 [Rhizobium sp. CF080]